MAERKQYDELNEISYGTRPKVLLVGNGLNLSFGNVESTDSIIRRVWKENHNDVLPEDKSRHVIWNLPFPLQVVAASEDKVQSCMDDLADKFVKDVIEKKQIDLIKNILDVGFDSILSTNYSLEFEKSIIDSFTKNKAYKYYKVTQKQSNQQEQFGIYQATEIPYGNNPLLWHIHGTALRKKSLVMGQLYYGKLLTEVTSRANAVNAAYALNNRDCNGYSPKSWVDYFLIGDVYIMGFSNDFSEMDIWWLLSYKKRAFPDSKVYFYEPAINGEKELMLKCYGVEMPIVKYDSNESEAFIKYYKRLCDSWKNKFM